MKVAKVLRSLALLLVTVWAVLYMSTDPGSLRSFSETPSRENRWDFSDKWDHKPSLFVRRENAKTGSWKNMAVTGHNLLESTHEGNKLNEAINGFSVTLGTKKPEKPDKSRNLSPENEQDTSTGPVKASIIEKVINMAAISATAPPPDGETHTKDFEQTLGKKMVELPSYDEHTSDPHVSIKEEQGLVSPTNTIQRSDYTIGLVGELPTRNPFLMREINLQQSFNRNSSRNMHLANYPPVTRKTLKSSAITVMNETSRRDNKHSTEMSPHNHVKLDIDRIARGRFGAQTKDKAKTAHPVRHPYNSFDSTEMTVTTGDTAVLGEVEEFIDSWEGAERNVSRDVSRAIRRGHRPSRRGRKRNGAHPPGFLLGSEQSNMNEKESATDKTTLSEKTKEGSERDKERMERRKLTKRNRRCRRRRKKMRSSKKTTRQGSKSKRRKSAFLENDPKEKQRKDSNNTNPHSIGHFKEQEHRDDDKISNIRNDQNGLDINSSMVEPLQTTNSTRRHSSRLTTRKRRRHYFRKRKKCRRNDRKKGQMRHEKPHITETFREDKVEVTPVTSSHNKSFSRKHGVFGNVSNNPKEDVLQKSPHETCPENRTTESPNLPLSERSVCPWSYYIDHDPNRVPHDIAQAKCRCTACLDPVTKKQNYNYACVPVTIQKLVYRRKRKKSGGYRYREEWQGVTVGCTCVQPRYSP